MIFMWANPLQGPLEVVGPENRDFLGPWNGNEWSECHLGPKITVLWRTAFSLLIYIYVVSCLANYGASEAVYPCDVVEEIHEYF